MNEASDIAAFGAVLCTAFETFKSAETLIREQYARDVATGAEPAGADEDDLLERPTRRFLVDGILRGLDWNPDNPAQVAEEARSWGDDGDRLYFDYLGIAPLTRAPIVLVEAKGYDVKAARRPRGKDLGARDMAELISAALATLKRGDTSHAILTEWAEWLRDLQTYVASIGELGQATLRRVVITAGRWLIVFEEPVAAFISPGVPSVGHIHCFVSLEDIVDRRDSVFRLLHRQRLVDTLSLTMPVAEALAILAPATISQIFRGIVVVTRETGGRRKSYPTRSAWPSIIAMSSHRLFAITDYEADAAEEPLDEDGFADFLDELSARGTAFEARLLGLLGRKDLRPLALSKFPGFRYGVGTRETSRGDIEPAQGSTAAIRAQNTSPDRALVVHTGEPGALPEYVVATGEHWFYKTTLPFGAECPFHAWPKARQAGVAANQPHVGQSANSFTQSGESHHCAHEELRGMRSPRCHVAVLETHLCCRACIFNGVCWVDDLARLPCPA
ncbi:MAG: hypothetical protein ACLP4V_15685 [Methylocella sp.]